MKQLSKSDIKKLNEEILKQFNKSEFFSKKDKITIIDMSHTLLVVKDFPLFFYHDGKPVPTLKLLIEQPLLKQVTVDMGAVKFVTSGADVMRPGITELDHKIRKDEFVVVVDETHKKPLAVAKALFSGEEIFKMEKGKVLASLHYVSDAIWKA